MWKHTYIYPAKCSAVDLKLAIHAVLNIPYFDIAYVVNIRYATGHIRPLIIVKRTRWYEIFTEEGEQVHNKPLTLTNVFMRTLSKETGKPCIYKQLAETYNSKKRAAGASENYANNTAGLYIPKEWNGTEIDNVDYIKDNLKYLIDTFTNDSQLED